MCLAGNRPVRGGGPRCVFALFWDLTSGIAAGERWCPGLRVCGCGARRHGPLRLESERRETRDVVATVTC